MIRSLQFISIKTKLIVIFLCGIIIPLSTITINSYYTSQSLLERKYSDLLLDIASQSTIRIGEYLREIEKLSLVASYGMNSYVSASSHEDYPIQDFLRNSDDLNESIVYRMMMNYILLKDRIFSVYIYNLNGGKDIYISSNHPIDYNYRAVNEEWFQRFLQSEDKVTTLSTRSDKQVRTENHLAILQARKIFDIHNGKLIGMMVVSIDVDFINIINDLLQEGLRSRFAILDERQNIIYHADTSLIGRPFSESILPIDTTSGEGAARERGVIRSGTTDYIMAKSSFQYLPWTTYFYMPLHEVSAEGDILQQNLIILAALMLGFSVLLSFYSSTVITRPIKALMRNMTLVEKGQFERLPAISSRDEIGLLSHRFNQMSTELKQLVERIHQEEAEKATAEIQALQSQINPHFLYNTLGTIKWIASMQRADKIVDMTEALISLLRYAARYEGSMVPIREELDNIDHYMTIQNVRYYNLIEMVYEVDEELLDYRVPKLILQPIVENAIFHGLGESEEDGLITVRIFKETTKLHIQIADNGSGMDQETLQSLKASMAARQGQSYGIGVRNVHRRIQLYFGEQYGITFTSEQDEGTTFTITIPYDLKGRSEVHVKADNC
ncbi:sensor histidine kinase [Paenibacillus sp. SYP-B4298]|uniref:sensor histidine kinase n=1 Tax=Paenibacillus sp. SYP-B4298 TaxID=2996034 RepID=UPI0022DE9440|nr:sensor histidine kinase [Paenibacillus sp. SYP-B4298]